MKFFLPRDAIITCIVNTMTCLLAGVLVFSILGYMAHVQETTIENVVNSGPGLVFLTYPDLVLKLPLSVMWAFIFFAMLLVRWHFLSSVNSHWAPQNVWFSNFTFSKFHKMLVLAFETIIKCLLWFSQMSISYLYQDFLDLKWAQGVFLKHIHTYILEKVY